MVLVLHMFGPSLVGQTVSLAIEWVDDTISRQPGESILGAKAELCIIGRAKFTIAKFSLCKTLPAPLLPCMFTGLHPVGRP